MRACLFDRDRFPFAILFVGLLFAACLMPAQSDTWWQLRAGEEMWRSGRIMLRDEFTHTVAGQPWPNHEWLSQIVFFGAYQLGGMPLLTMMCAVAVTAAWAIVISLTPGVPLARVALVAAAAISSADSWTVRPQVFTLTLFATTLWILVRRRGVWVLPAMFVIWANLHGGVSLGGLLIVAAAIASMLSRDGETRTLAGIGALCLAGTFLTPLGWSLWLEIPRSLARLHSYGVLEWRAPGFSQATDIVFWIAGAATLAVIVVKRQMIRSSVPSTLAVSTVLLFLLAARSARHIPEFFLCAAPAVATLCKFGSERRAPAARSRSMVVPNAALFAFTTASAVLFVVNAWHEPLPRLRWTPLPVQTMAAISDCPGRLYNRYDEGGYLIWFMKDRKVFIDSRQDPFPDDLVLEHIRVEQSGDYQTMFDRYDIACALTPAGSILGGHLHRDGWSEHRGGGPWIVYTRPATAPSPTVYNNFR